MEEKPKQEAKSKPALFYFLDWMLLCSLGYSEMPEGHVSAWRRASPLFQDSTHQFHFVILKSQNVCIPHYKYTDCLQKSNPSYCRKNIQRNKLHIYIKEKETNSQLFLHSQWNSWILLPLYCLYQLSHMSLQGSLH